MNAALAAFGPFPLEMFHHIGNVNLGTVDAGLEQSFVEQLASGADERVSCEILAVARLFAHEHDRGSRGTFSEDRLGGIFPEVTRLTSSCLVLQALERSGGRLIRTLGSSFRRDEK